MALPIAVDRLRKQAVLNEHCPENVLRNRLYDIIDAIAFQKSRNHICGGAKRRGHYDDSFVISVDVRLFFQSACLFQLNYQK